MNRLDIGDDKYIFTGEYKKGMLRKKIDAELEPTKDFWLWLQEHCIPECCGLDAYSFYPETIRNAFSESTDKLKVLKEIGILRTKINYLKEPFCTSNLFNESISKDALLELLAHIESVVSKINLD